MSRLKDRLLWFVGDFGRISEEEMPDEPRPQRTPFFIAMVVIATFVLPLLVVLVVIPGIRAQTQSSTAPTTAAPAK